MELPEYPHTYNELNLENDKYAGTRYASMHLWLHGDDVNLDSTDLMEMIYFFR